MGEFSDFFQLINPVIDIGNKAAEIMLKIYKEDSFNIKTKKDDSPVTNADIASNEIICEGLEKLDPNILIVSEENMMMSFEERKNHSLVWLVDPLDGTKEFLKRNGEFTINIALVQNQKPVLGIVISPVTKDIYYATKDHGAFMEKNNIVCRLECKSHRLSDAGLKISCSNSHINQDTLNLIQKFRDPELLHIGSSLKFMLIANGLADLYPRLAPTMEWDTAAPQIIVEEAGGSVYNFDTEIPLTYNKESLVNPGFIAKGITLSENL